MRAALLIASKDLRLRVRDRSAIILGVIAPLSLAFVFNLIFGDNLAGTAGFHPVYAVVDDDQSSAAQTFVEIMRSIENEGLIDLDTDLDRRQAESALADGELDAAFILPAGLGAGIEQGKQVTVEVVGNVDSPTSGQIARSIAEGFASGVATAQLSFATVSGLETQDPADLQGLAAASSQVRSPVSVGRVEATARQLDATTYLTAGMATFFLFFTVSFGVTSLLEERQEGTLARLLVAPISRVSVFTAKAITSFALGVVSMAILIIASSLLLGAEWGNPLGVTLLVLAGVLSAVAIMAVVAVAAKTPEGAGNLGSIIAVALGMLGGTFFPITQAGGLLSKLTFVAPHAWFLRGLGDLAGGDGVAVVLPSVLGLLVFTLLAGAPAVFMLRRRAVI